jgi:subtilase family serine protease
VIQRLTVYLLAIVAIVSGATIVSQAQPRTLLTRHQRAETRAGRTPLVGHLPSQTMHLQLVLQHRNQAGLEQFLREQQDPSSPNFRKTLTVEQFSELYGPSREDYEAVKSFARANGLEIVSGSRNRMLVQVRGSVENVEKALHVSMNVYQHDTESRTFFAPDREPTPDLAVRLWHVGGLDNYATPKPMFTRLDANSVPDGARSNATTGSGPSGSFLGSDMRAAYYGGTALTGAGQTLGLFELIGTDLTDLTTYYTNVSQTNNVPVTLTSVDTQKTLCKEPSCDDTEQTLDMTQSLGMAPGLSSLVMWIGTGGLSGQTIDDSGILNAMATASPLNAQLSCSWEWKPTDNTTDDPIFQEFAAQGQNFFVASGDHGKWVKSGFVWPADDPNIISVGGTLLTTTGAAGAWASEVPWDQDGDAGGGGVSTNDFPIPSWQVAAATACVTLGTDPCSETFRNGPDVAANAAFTFYVCADQTTCTANDYGGTSFATPMWAGYLALANEQSLSNGATSTLGFINPAVYDIGGGSSYSTDFHDVTTGTGVFKPTVGYDLATGWGSPNGDNLIDALAPAPVGSFTLTVPKKGSLAPGAHVSVKVTATPTGGFDQAIALTASGNPKGVAIVFKPASIAGGSGTAAMQIKTAAGAKAGTFTITITGTGGSVTETTTFTLTIT